MKIIICILALFVLIIYSSSKSSEKENKLQTEMDNQKNEKGRVTGIGGIFFKTKDPSKTKEWYSQNFGLKTDDYGALFEFRLSNKPEEKGYLQWSPFSEKTKYFEPSDKDFMINYRVENIEALVEQLKSNGVTVLDSIETYDYGKFVHVLDPDNNKIELWEPVSVVFEKEYDERSNK